MIFMQPYRTINPIKLTLPLYHYLQFKTMNSAFLTLSFFKEATEVAVKDPILMKISNFLRFHSFL